MQPVEPPADPRCKQGIRLCVMPLSEIRIPSDVQLLATAGADERHHKRSMRLSDWIDDVVRRMAGEEVHLVAAC